MKLTFWGAARTVTGSLHELTVDGRRYLLDCGTFQGRRAEARERNSKLPLDAGSVEAVVLSHAHIDHSGNLPTLVKNGYRGPIYSTPETVDLCRPMLLDSASLQERDAEFLNKIAWRRARVLGNGASRDELAQPLYTTADVEQTIESLRAVKLHSSTIIGPGVEYEARDAGHMLGSSFLYLHLNENGRAIRLVFSGDLGRAGLPIIPDPEAMPQADYLILESTYGDRLHQPMQHVEDKLAGVVNRTAARGGKIVVPAFAVGRTQQLVFALMQLSEAGRIPAIPIYVDSPLAVKTTEVFRHWLASHDEETREFAATGSDPFGTGRVRFVQDVNESKALNDLRVPAVIIAASGMCEGGRILHHLKNTIENPRNTVLITGFQAQNTLGRKIVEKNPEVPVFGQMMRLRAEVVTLNELSGHADQNGLLEWISTSVPFLKQIFLVHGEPPAQLALANAIRAKYNLDVVAPARGESFEL